MSFLLIFSALKKKKDSDVNLIIMLPTRAVTTFTTLFLWSKNFSVIIVISIKIGVGKKKILV